MYTIKTSGSFKWISCFNASTNLGNGEGAIHTEQDLLFDDTIKAISTKISSKVVWKVSEKLGKAAQVEHIIACYLGKLVQYSDSLVLNTYITTIAINVRIFCDIFYKDLYKILVSINSSLANTWREALKEETFESNILYFLKVFTDKRIAHLDENYLKGKNLNSLSVIKYLQYIDINGNMSNFVKVFDYPFKIFNLFLKNKI